MGIYCAEAKAQIFSLGYDIQWDLFVTCTHFFFFFFISIEDLFNIDEFQIEGLISDNRRLNEEIARLEKEKENEPVSKLCLCLFIWWSCIFYYWSLLSLLNEDTGDMLQQMKKIFSVLCNILIRPGYYTLCTNIVQGICCGVLSYYLFNIMQIFSGNEILH